MKITVLGLGGNSVFMSVDHFHSTGETLVADSLYSEPGGKGYNQAVAASRLGAKVSFIGAFGNDTDSVMCIDYLKREGITPCVSTKDIPCAYACIQTDKQGENRVTVYKGAAVLITSDDVKTFEDIISDSDMLILQNEVSAEANLAAFEIARNNDVKVLFNPAPAVGVDTELLYNADIITPNEHEAKTLFGDDYRQGISEKIKGRAVVTLGAAGADCFDGEWTAFPAQKVKVIDTTGGGDCFNGALAVALCKGKTLRAACEFAIKASAISVTKPHAVAAMPTLDEISD